MWQLFLKQWNGVSLFLSPYTEQFRNNDLHTGAAGSIAFAFGLSLITNGFRGNGFLATSLTLPQALTSPGRSSTQFTLLECFGPLCGPTGEFAFIATTRQQLLFYLLRAQEFLISNLIHLITLQTLKFNFTFTAKHVSGVNNSIADSLSCFQMSHFHLLAPDSSPILCQIPLFLTNV